MKLKIEENKIKKNWKFKNITTVEVDQLKIYKKLFIKHI